MRIVNLYFDLQINESALEESKAEDQGFEFDSDNVVGEFSEDEEWKPILDQSKPTESGEDVTQSEENNESDSDLDVEALQDYSNIVLQQSLPSTSLSARIETEPFDSKLLPHYSNFKTLKDPLKRSLYRLGFEKPTPIQQSTWETALNVKEGEGVKDVIGIAETVN